MSDNNYGNQNQDPSHWGLPDDYFSEDPRVPEYDSSYQRPNTEWPNTAPIHPSYFSIASSQSDPSYGVGVYYEDPSVGNYPQDYSDCNSFQLVDPSYGLASVNLYPQPSNMPPPSPFLHMGNAGGDHDSTSDNNWHLRNPVFSADPGGLTALSQQPTYLFSSEEGSFSGQPAGDAVSRGNSQIFTPYNGGVSSTTSKKRKARLRTRAPNHNEIACDCPSKHKGRFSASEAVDSNSQSAVQETITCRRFVKRKDVESRGHGMCSDCTRNESHLESYFKTRADSGKDPNKLCVMWRKYQEQKASIASSNRGHDGPKTKQTRWSKYYTQHQNDRGDADTCETVLAIGKDSSIADPSGAATQSYEEQQAIFTTDHYAAYHLDLQSEERNDQPLLGPSFAPSTAFWSN